MVFHSTVVFIKCGDTRFSASDDDWVMLFHNDEAWRAKPVVVVWPSDKILHGGRLIGKPSAPHIRFCMSCTAREPSSVQHQMCVVTLPLMSVPNSRFSVIIGNFLTKNHLTGGWGVFGEQRSITTQAAPASGLFCRLPVLSSKSAQEHHLRKQDVTRSP